MGIIRFLLAFAVVLTHTNGELFGIKTIPGGVCVELFFIISGFYMELILTNGYKKKMNFYLSRFFRLWPLFLAVFLGFLFFDFLYVQIVHKGQMVSQTSINISSNVFVKIAAWFSNVFMIGQDVFSWFYVSPGGNIKFFYASFLEGVDQYGYSWGGELRANGPAWSIGLEIWFYLLVPFLHKFKSNILILLLLASAALRFFITPYIGSLTYFFFPTQFYLFILGMLAFRHKFSIFEQKTYFSFLYVLLLLSIVFFFYLPINKEFLRYVIMPVLMFTSVNSMFTRFNQFKWDRFIGDLSYPIYIVHSIILFIFPKIIDHAGIVVSTTTEYILSYIIILLFSSFWVDKAEKAINHFRWRLFKK